MAKHKCKIPDPPPDTTRWMGTYGDMVTLLMAFFVMLFAVSETNNQKFEAFVSGLAGPFDNPAVELGLVDGAALQETSVSPIQLIAPQPGFEEVMQAREDIIEDVLEESQAADQLEEVREGLEEVLGQTTVPISADLRDDERGLVVSISTDDVLFPTGSAEISEEGQALIAEIAPILVSAPNTVVIEGHTDDRPINRPDYSNWNLSTDRAVAVLELLGDEHGMPYQRISATGFGEHRPLVPNDSEEHRSVNRRVELLVVGLDIVEDGPPPPPSSASPGSSPPVEGPLPDEVVEGPAIDDPIDDPIGDVAAGDPPVSDDGADRTQPVTGAPTLATIMGQ